MADRMHTNQQLRESLMHQADEAYIELMSQLDFLLTHAGFYLDRWPTVTPGDEVKTKELVHTVTLLGVLPAHLAEVIRQWKSNEERRLSPMTAELVILNEIWSNIQALIYFFLSQEMSLDPFEHDVAARAFAALVRCNRLLT